MPGLSEERAREGDASKRPRGERKTERAGGSRDAGERREQMLRAALEVILERGYAIVYDSTGKVLRSADGVAIGQDISVRLASGALDATVRAKKKGSS